MEGPKKFYSVFKNMLLLIPAAPFVFMLRILQPFIVIRLSAIDIGRIGSVRYVDWYLAECHAGKHKGYFDIFYFVKSTGIVSNRQWHKMWKRALHAPSLPLSGFLCFADKLNKQIPGFEPHKILVNSVLPVYNKKYTGLETLKCVLNYKQAPLAFTPEEEKSGQEMLEALGIPRAKPFICFHSRDSAYLDAVDSQMNWDYHDYRDSSIHNYVPAMEKMAQQNGYYAIRMGAIVKEKLKTNNPFIIDYATSGKRTDFLDIYLGSKCRFFLCSDTGMSIIPEVFRTTVVYVNWSLLTRISTFVLDGLTIPKKVFSKKEGRFLTFYEIIHSEIGSCGYSQRFEELGVELIENTPEEITAVTIEMEERLKGTWKATQEDEELQQRFWRIFGPDKLRSPDLRMGTDYLRQNQILLNYGNRS